MRLERASSAGSRRAVTGCVIEMSGELSDMKEAPRCGTRLVYVDDDDWMQQAVKGSGFVTELRPEVNQGGVRPWRR